MDTRKKVKQEWKPKRYSPVEAVKAHGDGWRHHTSIWHAIDIATSCALSGATHDNDDAAVMRLCERGQIERCPLVDSESRLQHKAG